jgi:Xaa-Pro aminopeptidase
MSENPTFQERVRFPIPTADLEQRWAKVRAAMKEKNIDLLLIQNNNQWLGGYVRWFTDLPTENAYPYTVLFPADDEMAIIGHGGDPLPPQPPAWAVRGIKTRIPAPFIRSLNVTDHMEPQAAAKYIKARNDKTIGLVSPAAISLAFWQKLREYLPGVTFVDFTDIIDDFKAIKSPDELAYIQKTIALQDALCAAVPTIIRPGRYEYEVKNTLVHILEDLGSEEQLIMMSSAPMGQPAGHLSMHYQNRRIERGDQVFIMIEVNGPGGLYGEIGRTWCLSEPSPDLRHCWDIARQGQKLLASLSIPGANPAEILKTYNEFLVGQGFLADGRLVAHGQGYDLVERPSYRPEETMPLKAGMNIALHPITFNDKAYAFCCDNYLITETGAKLLHKTPQEIFVIA